MVIIIVFPKKVLKQKHQEFSTRIGIMKVLEQAGIMHNIKSQ